MSLQEPYTIFFWDNCPHDILFIIFKKLDMKSLINIMNVNKHWRDVVDYYAQHFDMWEKMLKEGMQGKGLAYKEKSTLDCRDIILTAQRWNNVNNSSVTFHHKYTCEAARSICVQKDNLIVATNVGIKYFNIDNYKLQNTCDTICISYYETSSFCLKIRKSEDATRYNILNLTNKLHKNSCACTPEDLVLSATYICYKVHFNCCYVIDNRNSLWKYKAENCKWDIKALAKYYGQSSFMELHIHEENVYLLLDRGLILRVDLECMKLEKLFDLNIPLLYLHMKIFMFHTFSILCSDSTNKTMKIYPHTFKEQIIVTCPGLTCAVEHGKVLLMGYEDGKIEIFLSSNLLKNNTTPELQFYLQSYVSTRSKKITAIDIYEDNKAHHLFVGTSHNIYEFLIINKVF